MPTYYEMLKVSPSSSTAEIQAAVDAQYDQWRQLVTSHNLAVAEEANRNLRTLETIRATLMDPSKRAVYDASLTIGGLADPTALLQQAAAIPPPIRSGSQETQVSTAPAAEPALWQCPQCAGGNPVGTGFCPKCGARVGRECPNCDHLIYIRVVHCPDCGVDVSEFDAIKGKLPQIAKHTADHKWHPVIVAAVIERPYSEQVELCSRLEGSRITKFVPARRWALRVGDPGKSKSGDWIYAVGGGLGFRSYTIRVFAWPGNRLYSGIAVICSDDNWSILGGPIISQIATEVLDLSSHGGRAFRVRL